MRCAGADASHGRNARRPDRNRSAAALDGESRASVHPVVNPLTGSDARGWKFAFLQLLRFARLEALSCLFPAALLAGLALSQVLPLPVARFDALLVYCLLLTLGLWAMGLESIREIAVVLAFHLLGLALEIYKVAAGSWSYPTENAVTVVAEVPLFAGFMDASVGSYICQAWRRLDLRIAGYRPLPTSLLAVAVYVNFFTHHWMPDLRIPITVLLLLALRRTRVHFTVGPKRYHMPLSLSFVLIGFFLWIAENTATFLGAWSYPDQLQVWQLVHPAKFGTWSLLVSMSFILVAGLKMIDGTLHHPNRARAN
jgi:uncharacterized membrane protein YoaT (DUF817 family)